LNKSRKTLRRQNASGDRIRIARLSLYPPVTQVVLARWLRQRGLKLTQGTLARVENFERCVTDIELKAIARRLKTSVGWLCGERGAKR
jgi:hypothetical protein